MALDPFLVAWVTALAIVQFVFWPEAIFDFQLRITK